MEIEGIIGGLVGTGERGFENRKHGLEEMSYGRRSHCGCESWRGGDQVSCCFVRFWRKF